MFRCTFFGFNSGRIEIERERETFILFACFLYIYDYFLFFIFGPELGHYYFGPFFKIPATQEIFKGGLKIDCSKNFAM